MKLIPSSRSLYTIAPTVTTARQSVCTQLRLASSDSKSQRQNQSSWPNESAEKRSDKESAKSRKSQAQLDDELRAAMEGMAGDGGLAGAELEGGKAVGLKRGVRDNMFRYI